MKLNENTEVALHGQAADTEWTLELNKGTWLLTVEDKFLCEAEEQSSPDIKTITVVLTAEQSAAIVALSIVGEFDSEQLTDELYKIAEPGLVNVPSNLRIIP